MSRSGFIFIHGGESADTISRRSAAVRRLEAAGWALAGQTPAGRLLTAPGFALPIRPLGPDGLLLGRHTAPPQGVERSSVARAKSLLQTGWGRYLAFWSDLREASVLRDPSGAVDAVLWRNDDLTIIASEAPPEIDPLLPPGLELDWPGLARLATSVADAGFSAPLRGLTPIPPGGFAAAPAGGTVSIRMLWKPADFARLRKRPSPKALAEVVEKAVIETLRPYSRVTAEVSGGFDSAVVAATAWRTAPGRVETLINYFGAEAESDERRYARALASELQTPLDCRPKTPRALRVQDLEPLTAGFRPALHGLDVEYDQDMAETLSGSACPGLLTGQGGDAVFFQFVRPALAADRAHRLGPLGLGPRFLYDVARTTHRSIWTIGRVGAAEIARRPLPAGESEPLASPALHPWLDEIESLPPAKAGQVRALANSLVFWGDCRRARVADLLHPLLTQPVLEHCLAVPADGLAPGGRERGLARRAFSDRLPEAILDRRGKGELSAYYGQVVRLSLPWIRPLLLDGVLVREGVLDRAETERLLDPHALIWTGDYNLVLIRVLLELWTVRWIERLARIRSGEMDLQPVQNSPVQVDHVGRA